MDPKDYWNNQAYLWQNHKPLGDATSKIEHFIARQIALTTHNLKPKARVLDLGAGANNENYFGTIDPISLDFAFKMLAMSNARLKLNATVTQPLPFPANSFDMVTGLFLVRYLNTDQNIFLAGEIKRILKPEGIVLLIDLPSNQNPMEVASFDPVLFGNIYTSLDFKVSEAVTRTIKVTKWVSSGFGNWESSATFEIGIMHAEKP